MANNTKIRLMIVGVGPHAKRAYIPHLLNLGKEFGVEISAIVELKETESITKEYLQSLSLTPHQVFIDRLTDGTLPRHVRLSLNQLVDDLGINALIIASEPQAHKQFALWGLERGLHILMDKPVSTQVNAVSSEKAAQGILRDYQEILQAYKKLQKKKRTVFSVHVQRRYHVGFHKVFELIREVADKTGCPVTSIQSTHADGQWRLPSELVDISYHGYNQGYGKVSHSGYHFFDLAYQLIANGKVGGKWPDNGEVHASFFESSGLLLQMKKKDLERIFTKEKYQQQYSHEELNNLTRGYGEIDAFVKLDLKKKKTTVCQVSINLLHNSFSRRAWVTPDKDLYKGNGRVKHETHFIQQGPFQSIHVHSFQIKDKHDRNTREDFDFGGNNHFDIHAFRNAALLGDGDVYQKIRIDELLDEKFHQTPWLVIEQIKEGVVREFLEGVCGNLKEVNLTSSIEDQSFAVKLMSAVYMSHIRKSNGEFPIASFKIDK